MAAHQRSGRARLSTANHVETPSSNATGKSLVLFSLSSSYPPRNRPCSSCVLRGQSVSLISAHPDLPNRYLCHVLPGWQGPRHRLCSHRRRPVSLVSSTCLCLMSPDTPVSTLHKKSLAFAILSLSSKPTYIPTSVLPSVVQQTLSVPCLQRRNSWTLIQNPHPQPSLAPRPLEASTQVPPVLLPTSRWFVLPPYGLSNPHLILSKGP